MINLLFCLTFAFSSVSQSETAFKIRTESSEVLGLWGFVTNGSGSMGSSAVNEVYEKSANHTVENDQLLNNISLTIIDYFQEGYPFHFAVEGRDEQGWDVMAHYNYQAARSKTLDEFRSRTQGVIPLVKQQQLFTALKKLEPLYHRLIWVPNLTQLKKDQARLEHVISKAHTGKLISLQSKFYRSKWDTSDAFTMMLIPVPAKKGATHATVIGDTGLIQMLDNEKDLEGRYGVMMHEIGHSLYASETPEFQKEMASWFSESKVPTAKIAYQTWEEVLSTITGNGWAYEQAAGHEDQKEWYNNKEFNDLSKALYPLAKTYLDAGKAIDRSFVETAINEFQKRFPDAPRRNRRLLRRVMLLTDGTFGDVSELKKQTLFNHKWIRQAEVHSSLTESETKTSLSSLSSHSALIVLVKHKNLSFLRDLQAMVPELSTMQKILKEKSYITALDSKGRLLLVIEADTAESLGSVLGAIKPDDATAESPQISFY